MRNAIYILIAVSCVISNVVYAACTATRCNGKITRLYMPNSSPQKVYIGTDGDENYLNCAAVSGAYATLEASHSNFSEIYAALLAAHHNGNQVTVRIVEGTAECTVAYISSDN